MYILKIRGENILSNSSNLRYLCENCMKWFRSDIVVSIYTYPDGVHVATVHSGKVTRNFIEGGSKNV